MAVPGRNHGRWRKLMRWTRYWYLKVVRQHASPHTTARGVCLGFVIGALPIIPFQTVTAIVLAFLFKTNKLVTWLATGYSNIFTMVPFYWFLFAIGKFVMPFKGLTFDPKHLEMSELIHTGWDLFLTMLAGGVIFGAVGGVVLYYLTLVVVRRYHELRRQRKALKRAQSKGA